MWIPIAAHRLRWHHQRKIVAMAKKIIADTASKTDSHKTLLDQLVQTPSFTEANIIDNSLTFLFAGHETSSKCLTWTIILLATNPEVQERLATELCHAFSDDMIPSVETLKTPALFSTTSLTSRFACIRRFQFCFGV